MLPVPQRGRRLRGMSDVIGRDAKSGRFLPGNTGNGGRKRGARSKLGEAFTEDLRDVWQTHGKAALIACAENEPAQFCRVVASLMPKDVNIDIALDVQISEALEGLRALNGGKRMLAAERLVGRLLKSDDVVDAE
jgi:hypothetical protein